ncbi:MAG TPA: outer membrane beta-barrel protein [Steroidobacteraceae bacterium]|nr:outer membrane beta-barrel protein [Steroidobacteraceae bacterium]
MELIKSVRSPRPWLGAAVAAVWCSGVLSLPGRAADLVGLYAGGAFGQAQVEAGTPSFGSFKNDHSAYQLMVGLRPLAPFGVELAYLDFGHPSARVGGWPTDLKMAGTAAFAVMYLPLPVLDLYAKAGLARLHSQLRTITTYTCTPANPGCNVFRVDRTDSRLAGGVGVQVKLGSWTLRGEYEAFSVSGGTPGLTSIGLMYTLF